MLNIEQINYYYYIYYCHYFFLLFHKLNFENLKKNQKYFQYLILVIIQVLNNHFLNIVYNLKFVYNFLFLEI